MDQAERRIRDFLDQFISAIRFEEVEVVALKAGPAPVRVGTASEGQECVQAETDPEFLGDPDAVSGYKAVWRGHELMIRYEACVMLDGVTLDFIEDPSYYKAVLRCYEQQQERKRARLQKESEHGQELAKLRRRQENRPAIVRLAEKIALESTPEGM